MKTKQEAQAYARNLFSITGETHVVFQLDRTSLAYGWGWRWMTCLKSDCDKYPKPQFDDDDDE